MVCVIRDHKNKKAKIDKDFFFVKRKREMRALVPNSMDSYILQMKNFPKRNQAREKKSREIFRNKTKYRIKRNALLFGDALQYLQNCSL